MGLINKSLVLGVTVLVGTIQPVFAEDFRGLNWGASKAEVKKSEKAKLEVEEDTALYYKDSVSSLDSGIYYSFFNGKLSRGVIAIEATHTNPDAYIGDYNRINDLLTKKYGKPESYDEIWKGERNEFMGNGLSVKTGLLTYMTKWLTGTAEINHTMYGDNYKLTHIILYSNPDTEDEIKKHVENKDIDKL